MSDAKTVVLGCARSKRTLLAPVIEVLAGRGNPVEVVSGIEATDGPWEDALRRHGTRGVYLVCGDPELTLDRISRLRQAMAHAAIPAHRVWCGAADWDNPSAILRHAEQLLRCGAGPSAAHPATAMHADPGASEVSGRTVLPPPVSPLPPPMAAPMRQAINAPSPGTASSAADDSFIEDQPWGSPGRWKLAVGGSLGVAAVGALAFLLWPEAKADEGTHDVAVAATASQGEDQATPEPDPDSEPEPAAMIEAERDDAAEPSDQPSEDAALEIITEAEPAAGEAERVFGALAEQKIRALDILLLSPQAEVQKRRYSRPAKLSFDEAAQHCDDLVIDGVDGWRLPDVGELSSLTDANMLARSVYWSSTKGDSFGNKRVVWNAARRKMASVTTRWKGARTICVRVYEPKK